MKPIRLIHHYPCLRSTTCKFYANIEGGPKYNIPKRHINRKKTLGEKVVLLITSILVTIGFSMGFFLSVSGDTPTIALDKVEDDDWKNKTKIVHITLQPTPQKDYKQVSPKPQPIHKNAQQITHQPTPKVTVIPDTILNDKSRPIHQDIKKRKSVMSPLSFSYEKNNLNSLGMKEARIQDQVGLKSHLRGANLKFSIDQEVLAKIDNEAPSLQDAPVIDTKFNDKPLHFNQPTKVDNEPQTLQDVNLSHITFGDLSTLGFDYLSLQDQEQYSKKFWKLSAKVSDGDQVVGENRIIKSGTITQVLLKSGFIVEIKIGRMCKFGTWRTITPSVTHINHILQTVERVLKSS